MAHAKENKTHRIVSLAPNVTSILLTLGVREELVGVSRWCKDVAQVGRRPQIGDCWKLDITELRELKPTIVIGSVPFAPETVSKLLAEPFTFIALNPRTLADIENDIHTLGRLVNREAAAKRLTHKMQTAFAAIRRAATKQNRKPRVYSEAWPNPRISSPPWVAELIALAGGINAVPTGQRVSDQQVTEANPDIIILAWAATGTKAKPETALRNPAWKEVPAIQNKQVVIVRDEWLNTPGPPLVRGAQELLKIFKKFDRERAASAAGAPKPFLITASAIRNRRNSMKRNARPHF
jgi:iron complex transport system substrate-binding protein